jgi:hypothetical protein
MGRDWGPPCASKNFASIIVKISARETGLKRSSNNDTNSGLAQGSTLSSSMKDDGGNLAGQVCLKLDDKVCPRKQWMFVECA